MRNTYRGNRCLLVVLSAALMLSLAACGSANANATPTLTVQEIFTAAIETFSAQQATQLALTPPTGTPTPTLFPTLPALSPLPTFSFTTPTTAGTGCDSAVYVSDVTIPDNTVMAAGKSFVKTWLLLNNGSCAWSTSYKMSFVTGDLMGGADTAVPVAVPAGQQGQVSVSLVAPTLAGTYTGNWRMKNAAGLTFGNVVTVVIKVGGGGATGTPGTPAAGTFRISGSFDIDTGNVSFTFTNATNTPSVVISGSDYYFDVPSGWSGTVQPTKGNGTGWSFDSKTYNNVQGALNGQNYTATAVPTATP